MDQLSNGLAEAAKYLQDRVNARPKALLGRLIVKAEGVHIEITTAAGFGSDKLVPWAGINSAKVPVQYLIAAIARTIEEAVNPQPI